MNQHLYSTEQISKILKLAYRCNASKRKYEKVKAFGEDAALSLQKIVEGNFEGLTLSEMVNKVDTSIFDYNGPKNKYEADYIGIPEWSYVCCSTIMHGKLLKQTDLTTHASWMLFQKELKDAHTGKSESFDNVWFTFMSRLIANGYKRNVTLIHNYLYLMRQFSTLEVQDVEPSYIKAAAAALLDGLELDNYIEVELLEKMVAHLWNNPIFKELFKGYPAVEGDDVELRNACEFSKKILVESLWRKEVVHSFGLPLNNESKESIQAGSKPSNPDSDWKGISKEDIAAMIAKAESGEISAPSIAKDSHQVDDLAGRLSEINLDSSWLGVASELEEGEPDSDLISLIDNIAAARRAKSFEKSTSFNSDSGTKSSLEKSTSVSIESGESLEKSGVSASSVDNTYMPLRGSITISSSKGKEQDPVESKNKLAYSQ